MIERILGHIDENMDASLERWRAFLSIPSVGTDPAHDADTRRAAEWLAGELRDIGFEAGVRETEGQPMVVGHWTPDAATAKAAGERPHLLYYGHYDVQPADPLDLWTSPPFDPQIVEGPNGPRMVARGAVDDKGQVMTWLEAFRAWRNVAGGPPMPVTVFVEGEEESSSVNLEPFMKAHADELRADVCVISDTGMPGVDRPAVTTMLRGIVYVEVTLQGPTHDLHSGMYGGAVPNPINELTALLAGLHDADRRVTLKGFYDRVADLDPGQIEAWNRTGFDEEAFLASAGLQQSAGEAGRSVLERIWSRPTLDINGIWGGYQGAGSKTVIASTASAKLSCRLVPDMDPQRVLASIERYFEENCPAGCRVKVSNLGCGGPIRVPTDSAFVQAAMRAAGKVFPNEAVLIGCGGSIPVAASVRRILGMESLLLGFGLDDDRVHSPNEKFDLVCFERGIKTHARLLDELAAKTEGG